MLHSKTEECALPILAALREKRTDFLNSYEESIMFFHFIAHQYFRTEPGRDDLTPKLVSLPRRVRPLSQQTLWVFCLSGSCEA